MPVTTRRLQLGLNFLFILATAQSAWAEAVTISLEPKAVRGRGFPSISLHILEPIAGFRLELVREGGEKVDVKGGGNPGVVRTIDLSHPDGAAHWKGTVLVNLPNAQQLTLPVEFDTEILGPLEISIDKNKDIDVAGRRLGFRLNHPIAKVNLRVLMDSGRFAFDGDVAFAGEAAGTPLEVRWPEAPGRVFRIDLKAWDTSNYFRGVTMTPWQLDVPHEEVNFASGSFEIPHPEQGKLESSFAKVNEGVERFGTLAKVQLYIAGHTDTVGTNESNRTLSLSRARAIGQYFRKKGLKIPIFVEGFGEEALLVSTRDESDEPRNRRAEYIIATENPTTKNTPFVPRWQRL
jgi:outer membrane protein OmpA-like peptidoglycan-associated protein